ncbi:MAG: adenosylcobalamin-dependent ribonucleoside-diphosphate reductase [Anaerolineae bacterium]
MGKATPKNTDLSEQDAIETEELDLAPNAREIIKRRYLRKGEDGQPIETIPEMFHRVAGHVAAIEATWGGDVDAREADFYDLLTTFRFLPNSPTFTGAGTPLGQLAACFVLPIADDMGREEDGIFQTLRNMALIQQTGGGTGFSFSRLRPKGALVRSSGGKATGPIGFLRVFDTASEIISQGGARRGANMAVLRIDHPDIREFITCKNEEGAISNFNLSVGVTDAFMRTVTEGGEIDLVNPQDGEVWDTVDANELFDAIVANAYRNGEPGMLFLDTANRDNPCPHLGKYECTNPCGEQFLLPYENCCLGAVNLAVHLVDGDDGARIDWDTLAETVRRSTRFLDDVVEANAYVPAVPQLREAAQRTRRIGLGITGLADVLYRLRVRYGSPEGQELAAQVMEFIRYHAMRASIDLAKMRGPFPAIEGSIYDPDKLRWTPPQPVAPYATPERWGRPPLDWQRIVEGIRKHGIRNAAQTTVAPTGTRSTIAGVEGYGCEPVFALAYVRHVHQGEDEHLDLHYTSPLFQQALDTADLDRETQQQIIEEVARSGSCRDVEALPEALREVFVTAGDITAEEHVRMQAALQAFVDASISKTINFPADAAPEDVASAFQLAWELGCKGLTVYVTGSREDVVLETQETQSAKPPQPAATTLRDDAIRPRPHTLPGRTYRLATPLGTAYTTVNVNGYGEPFEVFLNVGKVGSDTAAVAEAIGRLISLVLRVPSPLSPTDRLQQVVRQLEGIGGGRPLGFGPDKVRSLPDGVAQVLTEHLNTYTPGAKAESPSEQNTGRPHSVPSTKMGTVDLCPDCGNATLISEEGCRHCTTCGYSEC